MLNSKLAFPKISIVMSAYNESLDELSKSIMSIITQTYRNIELIIVGDNPNNQNIKKAVYCINDKRIKFIENETNIGIVSSLNKAINMACGDFIARMDADDISKDTRLEDELQYLMKNELDIVGSYIEVIDENDCIIKKIMKFPTEHNEIKIFMRWGNCLAHPTWLVKAEVYQKLGGYRMVPHCEDYDFLLRAISHGYRIGNIPKVELKYRIRKSGISKSNEIEQFLLRNFLAKNMKQVDTITEEKIKKFLGSEEFKNEIEHFLQYKQAKDSLKHGGYAEKIKATIFVSTNLFFWNDIFEKIALLIRERK